jgi:hypothetical protein
MATRDIQADFRRRPWLVGALCVAVVAGSAALTLYLGSRDEPAPVAMRAGRAGPFAAPPPAAPAPARPVAAPVVDARQAYAQASLYADCEERAKDPLYPTGKPDENYELDPGGTLAARLAAERNARDARCRAVGPNEYRQVDRLLQVAAAGGDRDAQALLLRRRAQALIGRAQDSGVDGRLVFAPGDMAEAVAIRAELEQQAFAGNRASMTTLDQWLSATQLPSSDPVRAAAWRLVARQQFGQPFPSPDKLAGAAEALDGMDDASSQAVLAIAKSLFERCCRQRRQDLSG